MTAACLLGAVGWLAAEVRQLRAACAELRGLRAGELHHEERIQYLRSRGLLLAAEQVRLLERARQLSEGEE